MPGTLLNMGSIKRQAELFFEEWRSRWGLRKYGGYKDAVLDCSSRKDLGKDLGKAYLRMLQEDRREYEKPDMEPDGLSRRDRGNPAASVLNAYEAFFDTYTPESINITGLPKREKLLHLCVVLRVPLAETEQLLADFGYKPLYPANLFELCIRFTLRQGRGLQYLRELYREAADLVDRCVTEQQESTETVDDDLQHAPSRYSTRYFERGLSRLRQDTGRGEFLQYVSAAAPYFRAHRRGLEDAVREIFEELDSYASEKEDRRKFRRKNLYKFYGSYLPFSERSFLETIRLANPKTPLHTHVLSREGLLLLELYRLLTTSDSSDLPYALEEWVSAADLNTFLHEYDLPQLNRKLFFDAVLLELLSYPKTGSLRQVELVETLLAVYQQTYEEYYPDGQYGKACRLLRCSLGEKTIFTSVVVSVADDGGRPVKGVDIQIDSDKYPEPKTTGDTGAVCFQNLHPGRYTVTAGGESRTVALSRADPYVEVQLPAAARP